MHSLRRRGVSERHPALLHNIGYRKHLSDGHPCLQERLNKGMTAEQTQNKGVHGTSRTLSWATGMIAKKSCPKADGKKFPAG